MFPLHFWSCFTWKWSSTIASYRCAIKKLLLFSINCHRRPFSMNDFGRTTTGNSFWSSILNAWEKDQTTIASQRGERMDMAQNSQIRATSWKSRGRPLAETPCHPAFRNNFEQIMRHSILHLSAIYQNLKSRKIGSPLIEWDLTKP